MNKKICQYLFFLGLSVILLQSCGSSIKADFRINNTDVKAHDEQPADSNDMVSVDINEPVILSDMSAPATAIQSMRWDVDGDEVFDVMHDDQSTVKTAYREAGLYKVTLDLNNGAEAVSKWIQVREGRSDIDDLFASSSITFINPESDYVTVNDRRYTILAQLSDLHDKDEVTLVVNGVTYDDFDFDYGAQKISKKITLDDGVNNVQIRARSALGSVADEVNINFESRRRSTQVSSRSSESTSTSSSRPVFRDDKPDYSTSGSQPKGSNTVREQPKPESKPPVSPPPINQPKDEPVVSSIAVDFDTSVIEATVNEAVQFYNRSTNAHLISDYYWDFGDGQSSTEKSPSHAYRSAGHYKVSLCVNDKRQCTVHKRITVKGKRVVVREEPVTPPIVSSPSPTPPPVTESKPVVRSNSDDFACATNSRMFDGNCASQSSSLTDRAELSIRPTVDIQLKSVVIKTDGDGECTFEYHAGGKLLESRTIKTLEGLNAPADIQGVILRAGLTYTIKVYGTKDGGQGMLKFWQNPSCSSVRNAQLSASANKGTAFFNIKYCHR